ARVLQVGDHVGAVLRSHSGSPTDKGAAHDVVIHDQLAGKLDALTNSLRIEPALRGRDDAIVELTARPVDKLLPRHVVTQVFDAKAVVYAIAREVLSNPARTVAQRLPCPVVAEFSGVGESRFSEQVRVVVRDPWV